MQVHGLVSLGIGADNSFELAFAEAGIEVQAYDFSIAALPQAHEKIRWYQEKIGSVARRGKGETSLEEAISRFPGEGPLAMKMDIEGHEYSALLACPAPALSRVRFLTGEFHGLATACAADLTRPLIATFEKLRTLFEVVHVHANNQVGCRLCGGVLVPQHLEITWANRTAYSFNPCRESFPTSLDRPNLSDRAELFLGNFQFVSPPRSTFS